MIGISERGKLERMKKAVAGRWTGKPGKTGTTVLNPSESRGTVPVK